MTPQHAIFRQVMITCSGIGDTYDYVPDAGTKYPFIFIGGTSNTGGHSSDLIGEVNQVINVYAERTQRSDLDTLITNLYNKISRINKAFDYSINVRQITHNLIPDNTDVKPLLHAIVDVRFQYSR